MITRNNIQTLTGAKTIIETLKNLGVDTVFGYPGGVVLELYDEIHKDKEIKHILVRHEQSAVHSAEGYARETGKCGVVLVTSGPGATNTLSGIVNAYLDGYPLIVLTGQVFKNLLGKDAFQEANICDICKSCTKKTFQITSAKDIQKTFIEAYKTAMSGKKGPVVIDLVKDIFKEKVVFEPMNFEFDQNFVYVDSASNLNQMLENSEKPLIVAGGGVKHSKAEDELSKLVSKTDIPVVSTMMGLGTFPQNDKNYFGMIGIFGDNSANNLLKESDLVISLGARFNDRIVDRECLNGKLFQVDINKNEISRVIKTDNFIIGDIKDVLSKISISKRFSDWSINAQAFRTANKTRFKQTNMLHSFEVIKEIEKFTKNEAITFTSEVGQHQLWAVQNLSFYKDRKIFVSGGSGTMGFGLPSAIGAAVANPSKQVVCITGDGSFQMALHELATCKDYNLNIKIIILNNGYLGMVRQLQDKFCDGVYSETKISNPDFVTLAKSYGINGLRVSSFDEILPALQTAFSTNDTFVIDFAVEPIETL
ncbi:biosynthetic-type acetolactate synthase large subunit [bacterium]|nr:biosynthetic-type acetolactate synthase large subunit [bacterium]